MKFSTTAIIGLTLSSFLSSGSAFTHTTPSKYQKINVKSSRTSARFMAMDMDAAPTADVQVPTNLPVLQSRGGAPVDVRYSDFLKLVNADRVEKVTFSADGTKLLGVDTDGVRLKIDSLPNDPTLLNELTSHKVRNRKLLNNLHVVIKDDVCPL